MSRIYMLNYFSPKRKRLNVLFIISSWIRSCHSVVLRYGQTTSQATQTPSGPREGKSKDFRAGRQDTGADRGSQGSEPPGYYPWRQIERTQFRGLPKQLLHWERRKDRRLGNLTESRYCRLCCPHTVRIANLSNFEVWVSETRSRKLSTGYSCPTGAHSVATTFSCFEGRLPLRELPERVQCHILFTKLGTPPKL